MGKLVRRTLGGDETVAEWSPDDADSVRAAADALRREGYADEDISLRREADVKFAGQSFEISMGWPDAPIDDGDRDALSASFVEEYERTYGAGSAWDGFPIELHTARVVASGKTAKPPLEAGSVTPSPATAVGEREVFIGERQVAATVYDGAALQPGQALEGLALVDDIDTTLLVPDGARLEVDGMRNYVFTIDPEPQPQAAAGASAVAG
jgi:N-methylhydantoinase A